MRRVLTVSLKPHPRRLPGAVAHFPGARSSTPLSTNEEGQQGGTTRIFPIRNSPFPFVERRLGGEVLLENISNLERIGCLTVPTMNY